MRHGRKPKGMLWTSNQQPQEAVREAEEAKLRVDRLTHPTWTLNIQPDRVAVLEWGCLRHVISLFILKDTPAENSSRAHVSASGFVFGIAIHAP